MKILFYFIFIYLFIYFHLFLLVEANYFTVL